MPFSMRALVVAASMFMAVSTFAVEEQPELRAPWSGKAMIIQGNLSTCSHNTYVYRQCINNDPNWENTYALDIQQFGADGKAKSFDVLAPADGTVAGFIDTVTRVGGRQLWVNVKGPTGKTYELVFMHLNEIKANYKVVGAPVKQGEVIAVSGNTTTAKAGTGIHLHFHIFGTGTSPDSHTQPMRRLRLIAASESTAHIYESKVGDGSDDATKRSLNDVNIATQTFTSDNTAPPVFSDLLKNGSFETIKISTNTATDNSWLRQSYYGPDFQTLIGGGTWGHNNSSAYAYLGVKNTASQTVDSAPFIVPLTASSATLSFWTSIVTEETTTATAFDKLTIFLVDANSGAILANLGYMSNLSKTGSPTAYVNRQWSVSFANLGGRTAKLRLVAINDGSNITTWRVDDLSLIPK